MLHRKSRRGMIIVGAAGVFCLFLLSVFRNAAIEMQSGNDGNYSSLPPDDSTENPFQYIHEDFSVDQKFHSNLPIVLLSLDTEIPEYKSFMGGKELVEEDMEAYTTGNISLIEHGTQENYLQDAPVLSSKIKIKKRGHTSFSYDKPQYLFKTIDASGEKSNTNFMKMGEHDSWILNGSMADKSMIRNYLAYRIASEIGGNRIAPDSQFCEVLLEKNGKYEYCGVFLLMETVSRGKSRVNIDEYQEKNVYSSYIVRRDRQTNFDVMLDTYGRLNGLSEQWIGLKYPSEQKITQETKDYIEHDFSNIEKILYAKEESVFKIYDKYINIDSFVDYFLINEYFGNYDAGEHSTYMYKNSGDLLNIGPVWDFDQAMNNYFAEEMNTKTLAFQTQPFFAQLANDKRFLEQLKDRYSELERDVLSEEHVFSVIDETTAYLKSARSREWYRWAADYEDGSFGNMHNYYLADYEKGGVVISRFNDNYDQEIYNIKNYLHYHALVIQSNLSKFMKSAAFDSSLTSENELFLLAIMVLFLVPSFFINKEE